MMYFVCPDFGAIRMWKYEDQLKSWLSWVHLTPTTLHPPKRKRVPTPRLFSQRTSPGWSRAQLFSLAVGSKEHSALFQLVPSLILLLLHGDCHLWPTQTKTSKNDKLWLQPGPSPTTRVKLTCLYWSSHVPKMHFYIFLWAPSCIWRNISKTKLPENTYLGLLSVQAVAARIRPREGWHQCFQYQSMVRGETQISWNCKLFNFFT